MTEQRDAAGLSYRHVLLVEMLEPYRGPVYGSGCGSSGMFGHSVEFIRAPNGNGNGGKAWTDVSIYDQEFNYTTWQLAKVDLAVGGSLAPVEPQDAAALRQVAHARGVCGAYPFKNWREAASTEFRHGANPNA